MRTNNSLVFYSSSSAPQEMVDSLIDDNFWLAVKWGNGPVSFWTGSSITMFPIGSCATDYLECGENVSNLAILGLRNSNQKRNLGHMTMEMVLDSF